LTVEEDVVTHLARLLEALEIRYMISGSVASSFHGKPRTTHDADIVIDPLPEALDRLLGELSNRGFYVDHAVARDALRRRRQFNAIDTVSAFKVDLIIRKDRPFSLEELGRRQRVDLAAAKEVMLATAEDTILSKLEWAKKGGGSERQLADVKGITDVKGAELDREYIERWARVLGVLDLWRLAAGAKEET
jgi:acetolactate synthase regulatory subunit